MKYTEKWVWGKQQKVFTGTMQKYEYGDKMCHRNCTYISSIAWMLDYRDKIRAIDTDEKAMAAIIEYHTWVVNEWRANKICLDGN